MISMMMTGWFERMVWVAPSRTRFSMPSTSILMRDTLVRLSESMVRRGMDSPVPPVSEVPPSLVGWRGVS